MSLVIATGIGLRIVDPGLPAARGYVLIFDECARSGLGPKPYLEPEFRYLNRSARRDVKLVRECMEEWAARYPPHYRRDLCGRLRSENDGHFFSASTELYLHELLRRLGFTVRVHPRLSSSRLRRPDFEVRAAGHSSLLEATMAFEASARERAADRLVGQLYDSLNQLESPAFWLHLRRSGLPRPAFPGRRLRHEVRALLRTANYEDCCRLWQNGSTATMPSLSFTHDGCTVKVSVIPKMGEARGMESIRPIGIYGASARYLRTIGAIRSAVKEKATRYGQFRRPYIVAVNVIDETVEDHDVSQALFGREVYLITPNWPVNEPVPMKRDLDGAWFGPRGPKNRRVSGVLMLSRLFPWSVATAVPILWHNPWAKYPCPGAFSELTSYVPSGDVLIRRPGRPIADVLGFAPGWPRETTESHPS